jgi:hypothetical protein
MPRETPVTIAALPVLLARVIEALQIAVSRLPDAQRPMIVRIPIYSGRVFRREAGHRSDLKPATIPK